MFWFLLTLRSCPETMDTTRTSIRLKGDRTKGNGYRIATSPQMGRLSNGNGRLQALPKSHSQAYLSGHAERSSLLCFLCSCQYPESFDELLFRGGCKRWDERPNQSFRECRLADQVPFRFLCREVANVSRTVRITIERQHHDVRDVRKLVRAIT